MTAFQKLDAIRESFAGIHSIAVTDRDGVEILSSPGEALADLEKRHNTQIVATIFSLTHEQCSKLEDFGPARYVISEFGDSKVMLQGNYPPYVITIEADRRAVSDASLIEVAKLVANEANVIRIT